MASQLSPKKGMSPQTMERRRQVLQLMLSGVKGLEEIAVRVGSKTQTIIGDVKYIRNQVRREEARYYSTEIAMRCRQLDDTMRRALESYEVSRRPEETINTQYVDVPCPKCEGTGKRGSGKCKACDGVGYRTEEHVTRKVRGQAGDAAHLRVAVECIDKIARLRGLYPSKSNNDGTRKGLEESQEMLGDVPSDVLLNARLAVGRLLEYRRRPADVIDVEVKPTGE